MAKMHKYLYSYFIKCYVNLLYNCSILVIGLVQDMCLTNRSSKSPSITRLLYKFAYCKIYL